MVVPSWLVHEITSRVPSVHPFTWSVIVVSWRGANGATVEMNTSFKEVADGAVKASVLAVLREAGAAEHQRLGLTHAGERPGRRVDAKDV